MSESKVTAEKIADSLTSGDNEYDESIDGWLSLSAEGNVVYIKYEPARETSYGSEADKENTVRFRAVVVPGEQPPIVAERPEDLYGPDMEGVAFGDADATGWQVVPYSDAHKRPWLPEECDSVLVRVWSHINFAEARRMGAALIALADAREAALADQAGTRDGAG